jgi:hypothetical protein
VVVENHPAMIEVVSERNEGGRESMSLRDILERRKTIILKEPLVKRLGSSPGQEEELPEAGVEHRFERMTIHMDLADPYRSELTCYIDGKYYRIPVIHDVFFFGLPEVAVHMDAKEVYVSSGVMVVESYVRGKADRIAVRAE